MKHRDLDKKNRHKKHLWRRLRAPRGDAETTGQDKEQKIQPMTGKGANGVMRLETGNLVLPSGAEEFDDEGQTEHPNRVLLVIVVLALVFIAAVAYFVSQMPQTPK